MGEKGKKEGERGRGMGRGEMGRAGIIMEKEDRDDERAREPRDPDVGKRYRDRGEKDRGEGRERK